MPQRVVEQVVAGSKPLPNPASDFIPEASKRATGCHPRER